MIDLSNYLNIDENYYIYGTTSLGSFFYKEITALCGHEHVLGFLETKPAIGKYLGKMVLSPRELGNVENHVKVILASSTHFESMKKELIVSGVSEERIIIPYKVYDSFKTLYGIGQAVIRKICFWPPIEEYNDDLSKKIAWFSPDRIEVNVWCEDESIRRNFSDNVFYKNIIDVDKVFEESDAIFVWRADTDRREYEKYISKTYIVDPNFYLYIETLNYIKLYYCSFSNQEKERYIDKSKEIFLELKSSVSSFSKARVFCSGPSIDEIYDNEYKDSVNIICNSMVKDKEWLERIRPQILLFTDPNYFLSPTSYCEKFFEDVIEGYRLYHYYLVVFEYEIPLLIKHYPELSGKVIGISNNADKFTHPSETNLKVKSTRNILTEMMLPLASALCDDIEIAGCTGRNPDENFYWKHNGRTQYLELMQSIFDMYPSLFRDQDYANYYDYHCQCVEGILEYGEKCGKQYKNLTTSYIPALAKRT